MRRAGHCGNAPGWPLRECVGLASAGIRRAGHCGNASGWTLRECAGLDTAGMRRAGHCGMRDAAERRGRLIPPHPQQVDPTAPAAGYPYGIQSRLISIGIRWAGHCGNAPGWPLRECVGLATAGMRRAGRCGDAGLPLRDAGCGSETR